MAQFLGGGAYCIASLQRLSLFKLTFFLCGTVWAFWGWSFLKGDLKNIFHIIKTLRCFMFFFLSIGVFLVWGREKS